MSTARKCRWCATQPCPYESNEEFGEQLKRGGREWLEKMPCWTPFQENVGTMHDENGNFLFLESYTGGGRKTKDT